MTGAVTGAVTRGARRVALVHDWLTGMRGGEKVLEQIARDFPAAPIYTLFSFPEQISEALRAHPIRASGLQKLPGVRRHYRSLLPLFPRAIEAFDLREYDLVISTSHCVAKGVQVPNGVHVCYCHTPVRYAWDQRAAYFPSDRGPIRWLRGKLLDRLQRWDRLTAGRVDHYAANSSFVQERIRRFWNRESTVVHPPVDVEGFLQEQDQPQASDAAPEPPYLLSVAALSPYKRHDIAIRAAIATGRRLVIVGEGPHRSALEQLVRELEGSSREGKSLVELRGRVPDEALHRLFVNAQAFVQPGIEDFGIATVEALAAGVPVIAADEGGVRDIVLSGEHGYLYRAADAEPALVEALRLLDADPPKTEHLRARAETFSITEFRRHWREFLKRSLGTQSFRRLGLSG